MSTEKSLCLQWQWNKFTKTKIEREYSEYKATLHSRWVISALADASLPGTRMHLSVPLRCPWMWSWRPRQLLLLTACVLFLGRSQKLRDARLLLHVYKLPAVSWRFVYRTSRRSEFRWLRVEINGKQDSLVQSGTAITHAIGSDSMGMWLISPSLYHHSIREACDEHALTHILNTTSSI